MGESDGTACRLSCHCAGSISDHFKIIGKRSDRNSHGDDSDLRDRGCRVRRNLHGDQVDSGSDQIRD